MTAVLVAADRDNVVVTTDMRVRYRDGSVEDRWKFFGMRLRRFVGVVAYTGYSGSWPGKATTISTLLGAANVASDGNFRAIATAMGHGMADDQRFRTQEGVECVLTGWEIGPPAEDGRVPVQLVHGLVTNKRVRETETGTWRVDREAEPEGQFSILAQTLNNRSDHLLQAYGAARYLADPTLEFNEVAGSLSRGETATVRQAFHRFIEEDEAEESDLIGSRAATIVMNQHTTEVTCTVQLPDGRQIQLIPPLLTAKGISLPAVVATKSELRAAAQALNLKLLTDTSRL